MNWDAETMSRMSSAELEDEAAKDRENLPLEGIDWENVWGNLGMIVSIAMAIFLLIFFTGPFVLHKG